MLVGIPEPPSVRGSSRPRRTVRVAPLTYATCMPLIHIGAADGLRVTINVR